MALVCQGLKAVILRPPNLLGSVLAYNCSRFLWRFKQVASQTLNEAHLNGNAQLPYLPSWLDHFQAWLERLPLPSWLVYFGLWLLLFGAIAATKWLDGTYPLAAFHPFHAVLPIITVLLLALMHHLDHSASVALKAFRPVLTVGEDGYRELHYRLTTLPSKKTALATISGLPMVGLGLLLVNEEVIQQARILTSPAATVVEILLYSLMWMTLSTFVYHTLHQLRLVSHIYTTCTKINLFRLAPLYAFSWLAARTAIGLSLPSYLWFIALPQLYGQHNELLAYAAFFSLFALLTFMWPFWGAHQLMVKEKRRLQGEASQRLEAALDRLHASADRGELDVMDGLNKLISSLVMEQAALEKISTWPWQVDTMRLLATVVLLPVVAALGQRLLVGILGL